MTLLAIGLLLWGAWAVLARVTLREAGLGGRLESIHAAHEVDAPINGTVARMTTELGREVRAGDVLIELEAGRAEASRLQAEVRRDALVAQLEAITIEIDAAEGVVESINAGSSFAVAEADAERQRAVEEARWAREQASRLQELAEAGVSPLEAQEQASSEAAAWRSEARAAALAKRRIAGEARTREADAAVRLESLRRERTRLAGERDAAESEIARLGVELARYRITAPVDGVVGELADLRPGSVVLEGQRLLVVVPHGPLRAVAQFPSRHALGRLRPGQAARMRLAGFPWTSYGMIELRVVQVGTESRGGLLRAELEIIHAPAAIPLAHGLEGSIEVAVEEVSPLELALRSVGHAVTGEPTSDEGLAARPGVAADPGALSRAEERR
ncbi:MAG: HlyD family efflux transporter periplasmic adaptor subunit [Myxococcales bacterium]|nr:HlyD family efflux transporter periplasmic adaptor subunit [Myxococcales bacterium]